MRSEYGKLHLKRYLPCLLALACGEGGVNTLDGGTNSKPGCEPCAEGLRRETDPCGPMLDACINNPMMTLEEQIACFQADGRCYSGALTRSSSCHRECGDEEQANVESCTAVCFTDRANCAEQALRRADSCLDNGVPELCEGLFQSDIDRCDQNAVDCAETCKRVHRGG